MKSLKEIRLVYRHHLLPPIVIPFGRITDYLKLLDYNKEMLRDRQSRQQKQKVLQIHETIMAQLIKIKNTYIKPLIGCPFYYDFLDQHVKNSFLKGNNTHNNYMEAIKNIPVAERFKIHHNYQFSYSKFKHQLEENNPDFYEKVIHLPLMKYHSPQDVAYSLANNWEELSDIQKHQMRLKYQTKSESHWKKLCLIAEEQSMPIQELVKLIKNQVDPPLSSDLKTILFS